MLAALSDLDSGPLARLGSQLRAALPGITDLACERLAPLFELRTVPRGQVLLAQGDIARRVLLVEGGMLRLFFARADGREFNKGFFPKGTVILPLTAAMAIDASPFGVDALEASQVWVAAHAEFTSALSAIAEWHPLQRRLLAGLVDRKLQREHEMLALTGRQESDRSHGRTRRCARPRSPGARG